MLKKLTVWIIMTLYVKRVVRMMCDVHSNTTQPCEVCAGANGKLLIPPSQQRDDVYKKRKAAVGGVLICKTQNRKWVRYTSP